MKGKQLFCAMAIAAVTAGFFTGCSDKNDDDFINTEWEPIKVEASGINLAEGQHKLELTGTAPADGLEFTLDVEEEIGKIGYMSTVQVDEEIVWTGIYDSGNPASASVSGEWGSFTYLNTQPPYSIRVKISGNSGRETRTIRFTIGGTWYRMTNIDITQPSSPKN